MEGGVERGEKQRKITKSQSKAIANVKILLNQTKKNYDAVHTNSRERKRVVNQRKGGDVEYFNALRVPGGQGWGARE